VEATEQLPSLPPLNTALKTLLGRAPGSSLPCGESKWTHICTWAKTIMVSVVSSRTSQTDALAWSSRWLRPHASIVISTRKISKDFGATTV